MTMQGDISAYKGMDPDTIYEDPKLANGSITFFYVPKSQNFYIAQNPTSHHDMLEADEDLFDDVYSDFLKTNRINDDIRNSMHSRGQALLKGNAILGRIGIDGTTPLITFWESNNVKINSEIVGNFLKALYKRLPPFQSYQNRSVLLLPGQNPITVGEFLGTTQPNPEKNVKLAQKRKNKTYVIAGRNLTLNDLQALRAAIHTKGATQVGGDPMTILCHPDIDKYPELHGFKPASCGQTAVKSSGADQWRRAARQIGQYAYTSESFKEWFEVIDSLHIT